MVPGSRPGAIAPTRPGGAPPPIVGGGGTFAQVEAVDRLGPGDHAGAGHAGHTPVGVDHQHPLAGSGIGPLHGEQHRVVDRGRGDALQGEGELSHLDPRPRRGVAHGDRFGGEQPGDASVGPLDGERRVRQVPGGQGHHLLHGHPVGHHGRVGVHDLAHPHRAQHAHGTGGPQFGSSRWPARTHPDAPPMPYSLPSATSSRVPTATPTPPRPWPTRAAQTSAVVRSPRRIQSRAPSTRPPSSGDPGQVHAGQQNVDERQPAEQVSGQVHQAALARPHGHAEQREQHAGGGGDGGADAGDAQFGAGGAGLVLHACVAAEHVEGDAFHPHPFTAGHDGVAHLVGRRRHEEQQRTGHAGRPVGRIALSGHLVGEPAARQAHRVERRDQGHQPAHAHPEPGQLSEGDVLRHTGRVPGSAPSWPRPAPPHPGFWGPDPGGGVTDRR